MPCVRLNIDGIWEKRSSFPCIARPVHCIHKSFLVFVFLNIILHQPQQQQLLRLLGLHVLFIVFVVFVSFWLLVQRWHKCSSCLIQIRVLYMFWETNRERLMMSSMGVGFMAVFAVSGSVVLLVHQVHKRLLSDFMKKFESEFGTILYSNGKKKFKGTFYFTFCFCFNLVSIFFFFFLIHNMWYPFH